MNCPVCKTMIHDLEEICPVCGFFDLHREFANAFDATKWCEELVLPYRAKWLDQKKSADDFFTEISRKQIESINNSNSEIEQFDYDIDINGIILTKYNGKESVLHIPETIDGIKIYKLGPDLFRNCLELKKVILPKKLKIIGDRAFLDTGLQSIDLPNTLEEIGSLAFSNTYLDQIIMPFSLKSIGWRAFLGIHGLNKIKLNEGLETIGDEAFMNSNLTEIVFPRSLSNIPKSVCKNCTKLKSTAILGAKAIEKEAFYGCSMLEKVALSENLHEINDLVFRNCDELKTLIIPASVQKIQSSGILFSAYRSSVNRNILILNDSVEISGPGWENNTIFCRVGSTAHHFCRNENVQMKSIDEFA